MAKPSDRDDAPALSANDPEAFPRSKSQAPKPDPSGSGYRGAAGPPTDGPASEVGEARGANPNPELDDPSSGPEPPNPLASPDHARLFAALAIGLLILVAAAMFLRSNPAGSPAAHGEPVRYRLNVNAARAASLELLAGIGPTYAERIVRHRQQHGPFRTLKDLRKIRGIGPKRSEQIAPHIRFGPMKGARQDADTAEF